MSMIKSIESILENEIKEKNDYQPFFQKRKLCKGVVVFDFDQELVIDKLESMIESLKNIENEKAKFKKLRVS